MAYGGTKSEHAGAKKGRGTFYGRKWVAKKAGKRLRRECSKKAVKEA